MQSILAINMIKVVLSLRVRLMKDAIQPAEDADSEEETDSEEELVAAEPPKEKWDCESILSKLSPCGWLYICSPLWWYTEAW